jgi:antagonist of KipI
MSLRVVASGLMAMLVDAGRPGSRSLGVPVGGAADRSALALGNALVGDGPDGLALEFTLAGPTLEALRPVAAVVFGAPFPATINGNPIAPGSTFTLQSGDVLMIGGTSEGARGYLCVAGGFDAPVILGSRSSLEPIRAGDILQCPASRCEPRRLMLGLSQEMESGHLRVVEGPQREWFTDESFFEQTWEVSPASNRMGIRLRGVPLQRRAGELVSEPVAPGAVQVTNDGLPVVLGVDGQTIGGYPKIAHVIRADLDRLAQFRPGDCVRFVRVTLEEAEAAAKRRSEELRRLLASIRAADRQPELITLP